MLLAFDIGNTNISLGCFADDKLPLEFRLQSEIGRTVDEYEGILGSLFERKLGGSAKFSGCIISSVVPPITPEIVRFVKERLQLQPIVVGPGIKTGLQIKLAEPTALGADRLVNAVAAKAIFGAPALVVDFGTATSFDYVGPEGNYEGGIIAPGLLVSLDSLVSHTAKLPRIELAWPKSVIGKSTIGAMQAGAVVGYLELVDGLIGRVLDEVGPIKHIIATGGLGRLISEHSRRIVSYAPDLTLRGLKILYEMNR